MGSCQNAAGLTGCGRSESDAEGEFELVVAEFGVDLGGGHGFRHGGILVVVEVLVLVGELVEVGEATQWEYACVEHGADTTGMEGTPMSSAQHTVTGLKSVTSYDIYV